MSTPEEMAEVENLDAPEEEAGSDEDLGTAEIDPSITIRNEGQRLLLASGASLSEVGTKVGVGKNRVSEWRRGHRTPKLPIRKLLEKHCGIPVKAWDQLMPVDGETEEPEESGTPANTLEIVDRRLAQLQRRRLQKLTPGDLAKLDTNEVQLLRLRAKIEADQRSLEYWIVRSHPAFRRATELILAALKPYPEAAQAVADHLALLDVEHDDEERDGEADE